MASASSWNDPVHEAVDGPRAGSSADGLVYVASAAPSSSSSSSSASRALLGPREAAPPPVVESFGVESSDTAVGTAASYRLYASVFVCCLSPYLLGFSLAYPAAVEASVQIRAPGEYPVARLPAEMAVLTNDEFREFQVALPAGAIVGALAGVAMMGRCGRRQSLALSACVHLAGWLATVMALEPTLLIASRALVGVGVGVGGVAAPLYCAEVAPRERRVRWTAAAQAASALGIFAVRAAAAGLALGGARGRVVCNWRGVALLGAAASMALLAAAGVPESPKWLALRGRGAEARAALRRLRQGDAGREEAALATLAARAHSADAEQPHPPRARAYRLADFRGAVAMVSAAFAFQHFAGFHMIVAYMPEVFASIGIVDTESVVLVALFAHALLMACAPLFIEPLGRSSMMQVGAALMSGAHFVLSYFHSAREHAWWNPPDLALLAVSFGVAGHAVGLGIVPWAILADTFPDEIAAEASAIATAVGWFCSFLLCAADRDLHEIFGFSGVPMLFGTACLAAFVICFLAMDEEAPEHPVVLAPPVVVAPRVAATRSSSAAAPPAVAPGPPPRRKAGQPQEQAPTEPQGQQETGPSSS